MGELLAAVINRRTIDGPQDAIRYIRRSWDLEEMAAGFVRRIDHVDWEVSVSAPCQDRCESELAVLAPVGESFGWAEHVSPKSAV